MVVACRGIDEAAAVQAGSAKRTRSNLRGSKHYSLFRGDIRREPLLHVVLRGRAEGLSTHQRIETDPPEPFYPAGTACVRIVSPADGQV
jgi:hypothetical protein